MKSIAMPQSGLHGAEGVQSREGSAKQCDTMMSSHLLAMSKAGIVG